MNTRGGYRENAGRKGDWRAGKTKAAKFPEKLLPEIIKLAKALDEGCKVKILTEKEIETESKIESIEKVTKSKDKNKDLVTKSKLEQIKKELEKLERKIISKETGYRNNGFGQGIKDLKELFVQLRGE